MTMVRAHLVLVEQHVQRQRHHCVLSWDSTNPLTTELLLPSVGGEPVRWRFHRGVWADGLTGRTWGAAGDVLVEPLPDGDLHVWLRGEFVDIDDDDAAPEVGEADYLTSRRLVARFIRDTHEVVGLGREPLPSGDELLALLLGGAR
jgi:hypothetical protein